MIQMAHARQRWFPADRRGVREMGLRRVHWDRGAEVECRLEIEAPASEETLSKALDDAAQLVGLQAERF
jgi:hypothetical protein